MDPGGEILDVVDTDDKVVGSAPREEVHANGWMHRSVHILVFSLVGELFLQKRSPNKDENPGLWDTSAAGHVDSGEGYPESAHRELREELGLNEPISEVMRLSAGPETLWEHVRVYSCTTSQKIQINLQEISEGRFYSRTDLENTLKTNPKQFTSTFQHICIKHINKY
jgi:isopentenyldiphosphate isomerase